MSQIPSLPGGSPNPCVVILTALQLEAQAVMEFLCDGYIERDQVGTAYSCGTFRAGSAAWKVAVAECGPGNQNAGQIASFAISHFRPNVVFFVGVAGSLKADVRLGDVVASSKVYNYHSGKAEKDFLPRPDVENTQFPIEQLARLIARTGQWQQRIRRKHPDQANNPAAHIGPIAAGEQVDADEKSKTHQLIKRFYSDALAVEMEGHGTLTATNLQRIDAIIIRAISDNVVDKAQCDGKGWQPFSAHYACAFAFEMLANYPMENETFQHPDFPEPSNPLGNKSDSPGLEKVSQKDIPLPNGFFKEDIGSTIHDQFLMASAALLAWPTDLGRGEWISRSELNGIQDRIVHNLYSTTLVLGVPGSGKSALLARLGRELEKANITVLAIKADALSEKVKDAASLSVALGLSEPVGELLKRISCFQKVVLLLDQLDALASLVDLHSGRLNTLLNLVRDLDKVPNVHIICSCREFEHRHDARLTAIKGEVVRLALPNWEQVAEVLATRNIPVKGWSVSFQDLLLPPQHLKVFLQRLVDPTERQVFSSYQEMLDDLWDKRVANNQGPEGRSELIMELASVMANRESLWVPKSLFEGRFALIDHLIGVGILAQAQEGAGIGFAHQTLFEHALARAFSRERCSLAEYAILRQDGLFIRSTVWAGLIYLRGADSVNYRREFGRLWKQVELRRHLRHLLIDFLGGVGKPDEQEQAWLFEALLKPELEARVLSAVKGNKGWFTVLSRNHLPLLMRKGAKNSGLLSDVLIGAMEFAQVECMSLLRENWFTDPLMDGFSWQTINYLPVWNEDALDLACTIASRNQISRSAVLHLATQVLESSPYLAPRLVEASFRRDLEEIERDLEGVQKTLPDEGLMCNEHFQKLALKTKERVKLLLEDRNGWYGLEELAKKAPKEFLERLWPLFVRTVDHLLHEGRGNILQFRQNYCLGLEFCGEDQAREYPLPASIDHAIHLLARISPEEFIKLISAEKGNNSITVQRLLARGLVEMAGSNPDLVLGFLLDDKRRFYLGTLSNPQEDTFRLIKALIPYLSQSQFRELEAAISGWSVSRMDEGDGWANAKLEIHKCNRRRRVNLLAALPLDRLSPYARALIPHENVMFPAPKKPDVSPIKMSFVGSPMSADQMRRAKNSDILNLFRNLPDSTGFHNPRDWMKGGSSQASAEFERFTTASPERGIAILSEFLPGIQERPAGAGLIGLSKSTVSDDALFKAIFDLDTRGFGSEIFRVDAARALQTRLKQGVGLPDSVCNLLESWLGEPWQNFQDYQTRRNENAERPVSVLWQGTGMIPLPNGTYQLLYVLTYGYLLRKVPATGMWLAALVAHIERQDHTETWLALARELRNLKFCDHTQATFFLNRLFQRFPGVLESEEGAILQPNIWSFTPTEFHWAWLSRIRKGSGSNGPQAYGELITLRALSLPFDNCARDELLNLIDGISDTESDIKAVRIGIAFAAANLWENNDTRSSATDCLVKLVPKAEGEVGNAVMHVFVATRLLLPDSSTYQLLEALLKNPEILLCADDGWLIEKLEGLLPNEPELVFRLCREIINLREKDLTLLPRSWLLHAAQLTNIALTLHRLDNPYRKMGLELFEALLDIRLPDAEAALRELDLRPPGNDVVSIGRFPHPRIKR